VTRCTDDINKVKEHRMDKNGKRTNKMGKVVGRQKNTAMVLNVINCERKIYAVDCCYSKL
jgi:hypothetical protein